MSEKSLQVLSIGDFTHINDQRFLIAKKPQDNVSVYFFLYCLYVYSSAQFKITITDLGLA